MLLETDLASLLEVLRADLDFFGQQTKTPVSNHHLLKLGLVDPHIDHDHDNYEDHDDYDDHGDNIDSDDDRHDDLFLSWSELCDVCVVALLHTPGKTTSILLQILNMTLYSSNNAFSLLPSHLPEVKRPFRLPGLKV